MRVTTAALVVSALSVAPVSSSLEPRRVEQIVALQAFGPVPACPGGPAGSRVLNLQRLPNGASRPFAIPAGHALVITDFSWIVRGAAPDRLTWAALAITLGGGYNGVSHVFARTDADGAVVVNRSLREGLVVAQGHELCVIQEISASSFVEFAEAHGYLVRVAP